MKYPTLYMYMSGLPDGIASYPQAQTRVDIGAQARSRWPDLADRPDIPQDIREAIQRPWVDGEWISEVVFMAYHALIRDVIYRDDTLFQQFCYDVSKESFSTPIMRAMMHFVSPALLVMGASKRWAMMKRGSELKAIKSAKDNLTVRLTYPPNLYHRCMLEGFSQSFRAGINCTRVTSCSVDVQPISEKECHFHAKWQFM